MYRLIAFLTNCWKRISPPYEYYFSYSLQAAFCESIANDLEATWLRWASVQSRGTLLPEHIEEINHWRSCSMWYDKCARHVMLPVTPEQLKYKHEYK